MKTEQGEGNLKMGDKSKIEWTRGDDGTPGATWNPVTGCTKVSAGCKHCYAERLATRFGQDFSQITLHPDRLELPLHWRKPRRIFVNSMSDLFHEDVPDEFIAKVFLTMLSAKRHTFQILTKRPQRMLDLLEKPSSAFPLALMVGDTLPNAWLGVSVEDQTTADERLPLLLQTPAVVRFISAEPLLSPIDLSKWLHAINWVIVGGESGHGARPCDIGWIRSIRNQCQSANVACFVKQVGSRPMGSGRPWFDAGMLNDRKGGDWNEWPEDLRIREFPEVLA